MFTKAFARDLAERVVATFAEAWAALLLADGMGLLDAHWTTTASLAGMTALVALLKGVAAGYHDGETGASALPSPPPAVQGRHRGDLGQSGVHLAVVIVAAVVVAWVLIEVLQLLLRT